MGGIAMTHLAKGRRHWAKPSPGMGCCAAADGSHPGERDRAGWVDPPPRESSGATEALIPEGRDGDDEDATTSRRLAARGFKSISGKY
jgi:hypothetical protein